MRPHPNVVWFGLKSPPQRQNRRSDSLIFTPCQFSFQGVKHDPQYQIVNAVASMKHNVLRAQQSRHK
jgi:hypothetical protein